MKNEKGNTNKLVFNVRYALLQVRYHMLRVWGHPSLGGNVKGVGRAWG
jgi:hypothetical protein